jgi:hypothetical protein
MTFLKPPGTFRRAIPSGRFGKPFRLSGVTLPQLVVTVQPQVTVADPPRIDDEIALAVAMVTEPAADSTTYEIRADGVLVDTGLPWTVAGVLGQSITVRAVAVKDGYAPARVTLGPFGPVEPALAAPVISSVMLSPTPVVVGEEVTVSFDVTGWPVPDVTIEWRLDAVAIEGADGATYLPVEDDSEGILTAFISATNSVDTDTAESAGSEVFMGPIIEGGGWEDEGAAGVWLLADGVWNDEGVWDDDAQWNDGV